MTVLFLRSLTCLSAVCLMLTAQPAVAETRAGDVAPQTVPPAVHTTRTTPALVNTVRPRIEGIRRQGKVLRAFPGRWQPNRSETRFRWFRDDTRIRGANQRRYRLRPRDVGSRIRVEVRARAEDHAWGTARSPRTRPIAYRTKVRRQVTYSVATRGRVTASVRRFKRLAQETYDDPRGWRAGGTQFRRVKRGGDFTLVLATPSQMRSFSPYCSPEWSCRVGRYVIINQLRWRHASPAWKHAGRSLRGYRHMVVNHETGHWLGRGHTSCPRRGMKAPVMMQQSKGTGGCRLNPWPLPREL